MASSTEATIFVQIPAYLDSELEPTLADLYRKADQPERLRTVVLWQSHPNDELSDATLALPDLHIEAVDVARSAGPNWARAWLRNQWHGEDFTLILDSHHRFVPGWDRTLLNLYFDLTESGIDNPILTSYLPPYSSRVPLQFCPRDPLRLIPESWEKGVLTRLAAWPIPFASSLTFPVNACFASLHFTFGRGTLNVCSELELLNNIYFSGDEVLFSLLLQSAGYRLYHPHRIIGWHLYEREARIPHWRNDRTWLSQHRKSLEYLRAVVSDAGSENSAIGVDVVQHVESHAMAPLIVR